MSFEPVRLRLVLETIWFGSRLLDDRPDSVREVGVKTDGAYIHVCLSAEL